MLVHLQNNQNVIRRTLVRNSRPRLIEILVSMGDFQRFPSVFSFIIVYAVATIRLTGDYMSCCEVLNIFFKHLTY